VIRSEPSRLQEQVEQVAAGLDVPVLAVFRRRLAGDERDYLRRLVVSAQLEEWPNRGDFVHLADPTASPPACARLSTSAMRATTFAAVSAVRERRFLSRSPDRLKCQPLIAAFDRLLEHGADASDVVLVVEHAGLEAGRFLCQQGVL
jgi:hypothetical protein